jgi:hypothetical protein
MKQVSGNQTSPIKSIAHFARYLRAIRDRDWKTNLFHKNSGYFARYLRGI